MPFANGYTMASVYNWDSLGRMYIGIACVWTFLIAAGIVFLLANRDLPFLRIRNVPLAVSAVATLHVYWILCMTAYILNGNFPCGVEFWIMSIYLPLGIALYQASNTQLLDVASQQKKFIYDGIVDAEAPTPEGPRPAWSRASNKWNTLTKFRKSMLCIAAGMVIQVRPQSSTMSRETDHQSSSVPSLSTLSLLCFTLVSVLWVMLRTSSRVVEAGSGEYVHRSCSKVLSLIGCLPLSGNSHGRGSMHPTCSGKFARSTMFTVGGYRPSSAVLPGKLALGGKKQRWLTSSSMASSPMWLIALYVPGMRKTADYYWPAPLW